MGATTTSKRVDLAQLASLNGGVAVSSAGADPLSTNPKLVTADTLTDAQVATAITAYTYDPDWNDADRKTSRAIVAALKNGTATSAQVQKALAWVITQLLPR